MAQKPILLIGGYGITGEKIARLLRRRNPGLPLIIGGRSPEKGKDLAASLGNAEAVKIDLSDPSLGLRGTEFSALGLIAHDPTLNAMNFSGRHGIPYLCVTGGLFEFGVDAIPGMVAGRGAPIVYAGYWFAGAVTISALHVAERFARVDRIDIGIVIDRGETAGASGPATKADFERISANAPSVVFREKSHYRWIPNETAKAKFKRGDGVEMDGVGSVSSDVLSLGAATNAPDIRILEGWGISASRAKGGSACDEICIRMSGQGKNGAPLTVDQVVACPRNPSSFTVISTDILLERLAGISGAAPKPGFYLGEHVVTPTDFVARLKEEGVTISEA